MLKKSKDFVALSLTDNYFKIAYVKGRGSVPKVNKLALHDIKDLPEQGVISTVKKALKGINTKSSNVILIVPPSIVTTKNIEIPSTNPVEIRSIVDLQAGRHTPFSREEIQVGYVDIGMFKDSFTKVLLVIANKSVLKEKISIFERAGVKITDVHFASEGIARIYGGDFTTSGIIDVDAFSTEFVIVKNGTAIFSRNIPVGRSHLESEGESAQSKLIEEIKKTIESYESDDIDELPKTYHLSGNDGLIEGLRSAIQAATNWDVMTSSYVDRLKISGGLVKKISSTYAASSFLDVIAAAGTASQANVSLMPEEVIYQKTMADQGKEVLKTALMGFVILVLVASIYGVQIYFKNAYLENLENEFEKNHTVVTKLEEKSEKVQMLTEFLEERMDALDIVSELYDRIPKEVYLTNIKFDKTGTINVQGISDAASIVFNLGTELKKSEFFKGVKITSTSSRKDRGKDVSAFEITLMLKSAEIQTSETEEE